MELIKLKNGIYKGRPANLEECQKYNCSDCLYLPLLDDAEMVCLAFFLRLSDREPAVIL